MRILSLSDIEIPFIYGPQVRRRFEGVDLILGCGDLPYYYLEYVLDALNAPLFFVRGNHDEVVEYSSAGQRTAPHGGTDAHARVAHCKGALIAGIEGSVRYRPGSFQYTQAEMWSLVLGLAPKLLYNKARYGRYLDIFISHAPPAGIHDGSDLTHQGIDAFRWLIMAFRPALYFHGHIHIYRPDTVTETQVGTTRVINTYGFRETSLDLPY